jgi:hypothetical protein
LPTKDNFAISGFEAKAILSRLFTLVYFKHNTIRC